MLDVTLSSLIACNQTKPLGVFLKTISLLSNLGIIQPVGLCTQNNYSLRHTCVLCVRKSFFYLLK